jgi:predicted small metal-binding protein
MTTEFTCELDGLVLRAENDEDLVAQVERHIAEAHPELVGKLSRDDILAKVGTKVEVD